MKLVQTVIADVYVIEIDRIADDRGFFARTFCADEFAGFGLDPAVMQCSVSYNHRRGLLRGLHYQTAPWEEVKLVRCTQGAIYDVALDLRPESPTFCQWTAAELSGANQRLLYIPRGCAHGFQTLADHTEVAYQISTPYSPLAARGVRWNDPAFGIRWPVPRPEMSDRDRQWPDFSPPAGPCD